VKFIPLSIPNFKGKELDYVTKAVETQWVSTGGEYINEFEKDMAKYLNVDNAIACQSGTAALHLALKLCGVEYGDEVIVPTLTFIAAVNPVRYLGAEPIFMDCDDTLNMDLDKLEEFCENECEFTNEGLINKKTNKRIKSLVIVHVFGNMTNMERLIEIADKYKLKVVEDATEALGTYISRGKYKGSFAGTIGDFGAYSFNGNKIITTGGGGMLVAKDSNLLDKAKYLSTQAKNDEVRFYHDEVGYNYRMTNLQAALGVAQLEQLEQFIQTKTLNYDIYKQELNKINGLSILNFSESIRPNHWFYSLVIDKEKYGLTREELLADLSRNNIQTRPIWGLIHNQKPYLNNQTYKIEKANYYIDRVLNIPCSTNLLEEEARLVINAIENAK
jgi:perosamine synthetase